MVLDKLASVKVPLGGAELLLVDNASKDSTQSLIPSEVGEISIRMLCEKRKGKTHALNLGLSEARGEFIVFMDDDVLPCSDWLMAFDHVFECYNANLCAGQIRPYWPKPPPDWLLHLERIGKAFGATPIERNRKVQSMPAGGVKGGNFAVRRNVLGSRSFDSNRFDYGSGGCGGEDTAFAMSLCNEGNSVWFVPEARVEHIVTLSEMTLSGVYKRYRRIGGAGKQRFLEAHPLLSMAFLKYFVRLGGRLIVNGVGLIPFLLGSKTHRGAERLVVFSASLGALFSKF